ncbi:F1F0 ATP synthase assembly protein ATP10 [Ceratobasidium sp. AG-Ba]|nr:F1F0 ATP synthase assembly protein ATP10 [Ceratobasidium sp. AG-Ba]QRW04971.1 F1F0 ATP synthase assembly protein ATP10 [Ceratobasidium sp. AG-Ba]
MQSLVFRARPACLSLPILVARTQIRQLQTSLAIKTNSASSSKPPSPPKTAPNVKVSATPATESAPDEGLPLSFLSKPLGVADPPSTEPKSWSQTREELLDRGKHLEKRRHLVKQVTRGYFHDFHKLKHHGGKMWIAPRVLIREDKALYFPDVNGVTLDNRSTVHTTSLCTGRITLLSVLSTKISELHAESFVEAALKQHKGTPNFQYMQINLQENILKSFLVSLFLSGLRKQVPEEFQPTYILSHQNMEYLRVPLGMENKHIGYTYLVDENLKVRWAGCGFARPEETEALANCTRLLLERLNPTDNPQTTTE